MKTNITEIVFILDRSGSMAGLESDTVGGYNAMLEKQKGAPGEAVVTTVLFDDRYELLHDRANVKSISLITEKEYFVRGSTALLDAIGSTIQKISNAQKHVAPAYRADKVIVVITTDGMENASREYSPAQIKEMIKQKQKKCGWEFIFLGANIDAVSTAKEYGIPGSRAANYRADSKGTSLNYRVVGDAICEMRASTKLADDWKADIEEYHESQQ